MIVDKIKQALQQRSQITGFFIKLFVLFSLWFFVYGLLLKPSRRIDRPITHFLTVTCVKAINFITPADALTWEPDKVKDCTHLMRNGQSMFRIFDVCNGIDLMFIYAGIIMLLPGTLRRKTVFIAAGIGVIIVANIIRITSLYYIYFHLRNVFNFSHHYFFTLLMYILIVYGWILFIKPRMQEEISIKKPTQS
jgi:exosortase/archaeosortase family protein